MLQKNYRLLIMLLIAVTSGQSIITKYEDAVTVPLRNKELEESEGKQESCAQAVLIEREPLKKGKNRLINFDFSGEELVNIINFLASKKNVNIIFPQGDAAIKSKLTLKLAERITLNEAWNILQTILNLAGYVMVPNNNGYSIVRDSNNVVREPLPIYIGVKPEELPDIDQPIRYLYYLANIKVSESGDSELSAVLKELLPATASYKIDAATNAIIVSGRSSDIKQVMRIILQLDMVCFQEDLEIITLRYAKARMVADLFNENILKTATDINRHHLDTRKRNEATYFSRHTRLIPEERSNSVVIIGRQQAIERIKNFIREYIDIEPDSGQSILHIYQLQYLNAEQFEPVLRRIVESSRPGGSDQARVAGGATGGPERFFDDVIIKVDKPSDAEKAKTYGTNKLVIAARNYDWKRIEELIQKLDTPQPQVLIEMLIADLTVNDARLIGTMFRNPLKLPLPNQINVQSAQLNAGVLPNRFENPQTIGVITQPETDPITADLLRKAFDTACARNDAGPLSAASTCFVRPGSTVVSFNDNTGSTWGLAQFLQNFAHTKILSHPHVITTNNVKAQVVIGETRLVDDEATGSLGGTTIRKKIPYSANLQVEVTPRLSSADTVNLQVVININEFIVGGQNAQVTRQVATNVNINSKDILSIGGLIRDNSSNNSRKTPLLGDIPLIGWFFKERDKALVKTNLTVFISPTIILPRLREGVSDYTKDYIKTVDSYAQEGDLFDSLRDPITRWFFKTGNSTASIIDNFLAKDSLKNKDNPALAQETNSSSIFDKKKTAAELKERVKGDESPFAKRRARAQFRSPAVGCI